MNNRNIIGCSKQNPAASSHLQAVAKLPESQCLRRDQGLSWKQSPNSVHSFQCVHFFPDAWNYLRKVRELSNFSLPLKLTTKIYKAIPRGHIGQ
jgi:hypothetical protein